MVDTRLKNLGTSIKFKMFDNLVAAYFFISPLEFALNAVFPGGSTVKYLGAAIIILLMLYLYRDSEKVKIKAFHISMYLWIITVLVSYFWTQSISYALIYIKSYVNMVIFFIVLTSVNYTQKQIRLYINSMLLGSTMSAIIMLSNLTLYHGVGNRYTFNIGSAQLDPNNAAAFLCYGVVISLYYLLNSVYKKKIVYLILFGVNLIALFFTGSRGGFLTIFITIVIILINNYRVKHNFVITSVKNTIIIALLFVVVVLALNYFVPEELLDRILQFESYGEGSERTIIWNYALNMLIEKPIVGYGIGSFPVIASMFFGLNKGMHNTYLMVLFENGIAGFCFFISGIIMLAYRAKRNKHFFALIMLFTSLIPSFFLDALVQRFFWNGLILCYILTTNINYKNTLR